MRPEEIRSLIIEILGSERISKSDKARLLEEIINTNMDTFNSTKIERKVFARIFMRVGRYELDAFIRFVMNEIAKDPNNSNLYQVRVISFFRLIQGNKNSNLRAFSELVESIVKKVID